MKSVNRTLINCTAIVCPELGAIHTGIRDFIINQYFKRHAPLENGFGGVRRWRGWRQGLSGRGEEGGVVAEHEVLVEREPLDAAVRLGSDRAAELLDERELHGLVRALEDRAARPELGHYAASAPHVDRWPVVALACAHRLAFIPTLSAHSTPSNLLVGSGRGTREYKKEQVAHREEAPAVGTRA